MIHLEHRKATQLGLVAAVATIAALTLFPAASTDIDVARSCIICGDRGTADFLSNLILFAPLGALLSLAGIENRRVILRCAALSGGIELAQLLIPGRTTTLGDLLANTLGGAAGLLVINLIRRRGTPLATTIGWRKTGIYCAVFALVLMATAYLLTPEYPATTYYGQWTPTLRHLEHYDGRVLEAHVGDLPTRDGPLSESREIRAALEARQSAEIRMIAGSAPSKLAPIVSIADDRQQEILLIGADRQDLVVRRRLRADRLRFDRPDLRVASMLDGIAPEDTVVVRFDPDEARECLALNERSHCGLGYSGGIGWALLIYPEHLPSGARASLSGLWLFMLTLPIGFLPKSKSQWVTASAATAAMLALVPFQPGLQPSGVVEWCGLFGGVVCGRLFERFHRRARDNHLKPSPALGSQTLLG